MNGQTADSLLQRITESEDSLKASLYNRLSEFYQTRDSFHQAIRYAHQAVSYASRFDQEREQYEGMMYLAYNFLDLGIPDSATYWGRVALQIAEEMGDSVRIARSWNNLGNCWINVPAADKALTAYLNALKLLNAGLPGVSEERHKLYKALVYNNIGAIYSKVNLPELALSYFYPALSIRKDLNDSSGIASTMQNIGVIHEKLENLDSAFMMYREALQIRKKLGQNAYAAELYLNLGILNRKAGNYDSSEIQLKKAYDITTESDNNGLKCTVLINFALLYRDLNRSEQAYRYADSAYRMARENRYYQVQDEAAGFLSDWFASRGDFREAYRFAMEERAVSDTIFNQEMADKITEMRIRYETERQEHQIELLTRDREIQAMMLDRRNNQLLILGITVGLVVSLLLVLLLLLNRRRLVQQKTRAELEKSKLLESRLRDENAYQNKQLTTHALNMIQKNKLLRQLDNELKSFLHGVDDETTQSRIRKIRREINRNMNLENDWRLFRNYFEEVNRDFYNRLRKKAGKLTAGEIRLAALIRLNLNIKEAAGLLNISPESLRKARYRLRRKLGLKREENLTDYLNSL
ncbi:MAG: hypothetical protein Kow00127_18150 [Bacteroidales bacterium]